MRVRERPLGRIPPPDGAADCSRWAALRREHVHLKSSRLRCMRQGASMAAAVIMRAPPLRRGARSLAPNGFRSWMRAATAFSTPRGRISSDAPSSAHGGRPHVISDRTVRAVYLISGAFVTLFCSIWRFTIFTQSLEGDMGVLPVHPRPVLDQKRPFRNHPSGIATGEWRTQPPAVVHDHAQAAQPKPPTTRARRPWNTLWRRGRAPAAPPVRRTAAARRATHVVHDVAVVRGPHAGGGGNTDFRSTAVFVCHGGPSRVGGTKRRVDRMTA